jgi:hypothetical protein
MTETTQKRTRNVLNEVERTKYIQRAYAMLLSGHQRSDVSVVLKDRLRLSPSTASNLAGQAQTLLSKFLSERYDPKTDTFTGTIPNAAEAIKSLTQGETVDDDPFAQFFDDMPAVRRPVLETEVPNGVDRPFVPSEEAQAEGEAETEAEGEASADVATEGAPAVDTSAFDKASPLKEEPRTGRNRRR